MCATWMGNARGIRSSVSVPCVMTMPLTFGSARSSLQRLASVRRTWSVRLLDEIFTICSPVDQRLDGQVARLVARGLRGGGGGAGNRAARGEDRDLRKVGGHGKACGKRERDGEKRLLEVHVCPLVWVNIRTLRSRVMSAPLSERDGRFILPNEPVHTLEDKPRRRRGRTRIAPPPIT